MRFPVTGLQVLSYMTLPGIVPRVRGLLGAGFSSLAYFIALVYRAVNILPAAHPYLNYANVGRYGVRHVVAEAANHLTLGWKNIDRLIIFATILCGLVLLCLQFAMLMAIIFASPAMAAAFGGIAEFFVTPNPQEDLAFRLLERVFGVPELFNSKEISPTSYHYGLYRILQVYSGGLLVVAVFILIYFIFAVAAETAQTGTAFGKRFNHVWAPVRLVVAFGLLVPIGYGLNSAQWITLYTAKFGSGFASQGWALFNERLGESFQDNRETFVAEPEIPEVRSLATFLMIAKTCKIAEERKNNVTDIKAWLISDTGTREPVPFARTDYDTAVAFSDFEKIHIVFGVKDGTRHNDEPGKVNPLCGDLIFSITDVALFESTRPGSYTIQKGYYDLVKTLWLEGGDGEGLDYGMERYARNYTYHYLSVEPRHPQVPAPLPTPSFKDFVLQGIENDLRQIVRDGVEAQRTLSRWEINQELRDYGWAGAAIWYNKITELNGTIMSAVLNVPEPKDYPVIMRKVEADKNRAEKRVPPSERYTPSPSRGVGLYFPVPGDKEIAETLNKVFLYWEGETRLTGNAFIDAINALLGTKGLFDMCKNTNTHPLAQLSQVGKGLIESAIRNFGFTIGAVGAGGMAYLMSPHIGSASFAASGFFVTVASIGLLAGFLLFYIMPFMPFLYFFFAVGGWIKGLFEAMVGVPLWALAHLRIDGEGLPGEAAAQGYYLILEIFIRPILIIFGFLGAILSFSAMVKILNEIYYLAVSNLGGFSSSNQKICGEGILGNLEIGSAEFFRGPVDELFFTVMYTIIVYMIGMSAFKMIDLVPNQILRWMGASAPTFNDQAGEPAEGLVQRITFGGGMIGRELQQGFSSVTKTTEEASKAAKIIIEKQKQQQGPPNKPNPQNPPEGGS